MLKHKLLNTIVRYQQVYYLSSSQVPLSSKVDYVSLKKTSGGGLSKSIEVKLNKPKHRRYENHAPILFKWSQKIVGGELPLETLLESKQFKFVSNEICDTIFHSDKNILNLIKSTLIMNLDPESRMVKFLEDELLLKIQLSFDLKLLTEAFELYQTFQDTQKRMHIMDTLTMTINEKLDNSSASLFDLIRLIRLSRNLSPEIRLKIEDQLTKILDSQENISLDNLCYLIVQLSRFNRRNKPLIRAVVSKLLKYRSEEIYSMPPHLINMISSLSRLNFPEINLLEKCSDILINLDFFENISDSSRRDFTVAISNFNFSYSKLIDYYLQKLVDKPELFLRQDLVALVIMLSRLNYKNEELVAIIETNVIPKCKQEDFLSNYQWFNYVFSLALLKCATLEHFRSITRKSFYDSMEQDEIENYSSIQKLQSDKLGESNTTNESTSTQEIYNLLNIKRKYSLLYGLIKMNIAHSSKSLMDYFDSESEKINFENHITNLNLDMFKQSKDLQNFRSKLISSLESFSPSKDRYMSVMLKTQYGFFIDAEMNVNSECKPQILNDPGSLLKDFSVQKSENKELGNKRIAIMCIGFNDTLLDSSSLIGPKALELDILRSCGYVVIPVYQNSMPSSVTLLNRVKFLQNLIASQLKNDS